jgi:hypothetical protein
MLYDIACDALMYWRKVWEALVVFSRLSLSPSRLIEINRLSPVFLRLRAILEPTNLPQPLMAFRTALC